MEQPDPKHYNDFLQNSIQLLDTLVLGIELPPEIVAAINRQTQQYYEIQEYKYRVEREAQELTRKQIEANGIAAFQRTVSEGISDSYLRWRGIEATLALAQSRNSKIVIIGSGKDGLPIILGNVDNVCGIKLQSHRHRGRCGARMKRCQQLHQLKSIRCRGQSDLLVHHQREPKEKCDCRLIRAS